eukprot:1635338-Pyramimonas_sp.AAC.1
MLRFTVISPLVVQYPLALPLVFPSSLLEDAQRRRMSLKSSLSPSSLSRPPSTLTRSHTHVLTYSGLQRDVTGVSEAQMGGSTQ